MNSEDSRNLILAIVLSAIVLIGWNVLFAPKSRVTPPAQTVTSEATPTPGNGAAPAASAPGAASSPDVPKPRADALAEHPRVKLDAPDIGGSINLDGGALDDVFLKHYKESLKPDSPDVVLFSPNGSVEPYWSETGFVSNNHALKLPTRTTRWTSSGGDLTPEHPVTLTWDNGDGLVFTREFAVDDRYMFTVTDKVENKGSAPVGLSPYAYVLRQGIPKVSGYSVLHEGFVGVIGDAGVQQVTYAGIEKETDRLKTYKGPGGWLGFTDKYWASAVIPGQNEPIEARFSATGPAARPDFQAAFVAPESQVAAGASTTQQTHIFAGAKEVSVIDGYASQYGIKKFDLMIDWGWFYFITKPLFYLIDFIYKFVGNFGVAILCVTVLVKAVFFPLANQSYRSMARMKMLQPKLAALKEQYPGDTQKQQQAQMELMRKEGVNPVAGCLPMLIQIPVFFALYKVIFITIEMRHAPFFGWIHDLSAPDPTNVFNLFGLLPIDPTGLPVFGHFLALGVWPLVMGFTMFLQMKMQPEPTDPTQKMMFTYMPVIFTFMFGSFPAGLVIYYAWNNTLTILQQSLIMKRAGNRVELFDNLRNMFRRPPKAAL